MVKVEDLAESLPNVGQQAAKIRLAFF